MKPPESTPAGKRLEPRSPAPDELPTARGVIVAAGRSRRMGEAGGTRKPLLELGGQTLLERVLGVFERAERVGCVVILTHADDLPTVRALVASSPGAGKVRAVLAGGTERSDSVRIGARHPIEGDLSELICIHDAARPLVTPEEVDRVIAAAADAGAALLAIPVRDTLKHSDDAQRAEHTVARAHLWAAQTPQVFERKRFLECLERAEQSRWNPTDDSALWEEHIGPVTLVRGSAQNFKVTEPEDLALAQAILEARARTQASPAPAPDERQLLPHPTDTDA